LDGLDLGEGGAPFFFGGGEVAGEIGNECGAGLLESGAEEEGAKGLAQIGAVKIPEDEVEEIIDGPGARSLEDGGSEEPGLFDLNLMGVSKACAESQGQLASHGSAEELAAFPAEVFQKEDELLDSSLEGPGGLGWPCPPKAWRIKDAGLVTHPGQSPGQGAEKPGAIAEPGNQNNGCPLSFEAEGESGSIGEAEGGPVAHL